jgi:integrase
LVTIRHKRLAALLDAADPWNPILLEVAARTGLRRGEAIGLVWSEVDFAGSLSITRQLNAVGRRVALKTDRSARTVDLSARLTELREHRLASPRSADHDFVFVRRTGAHYTPDAARSVIDKAARMARLQGVEPAGEWIVAPLTFHSLRHTHVSRLIAAGWDVQEIASRIGDTAGTVMTAYAHDFDAVARAQSRHDRLGAMEALVEASTSNITRQSAVGQNADVVDMQAVRHRAQ